MQTATGKFGLRTSALYIFLAGATGNSSASSLTWDFATDTTREPTEMHLVFGVGCLRQMQAERNTVWSRFWVPFTSDQMELR